jgi:quercetin dioxygenase-like cupin family protein
MKKIALTFFLALFLACFDFSLAIAASNQNMTVLHVDQQKSFAVGQDIFTFRSFTDSVDPEHEADFSVVEITNAPQQSPGGFLLEQHVISFPEEFYILSGKFEFVNRSGKSIEVGAGDRVYIPAGVPYGYKNVGNGSAQVLLITPSQNLEKFIAQVGQSISTGTSKITRAVPPDMGKIASIAPRYGIEFLN